jgi:hypothetical protein
MHMDILALKELNQAAKPVGLWQTKIRHWPVALDGYCPQGVLDTMVFYRLELCK